MKKILMMLITIAAVCVLAGPVLAEIVSGGVTASRIGLSTDDKGTPTYPGMTFKESDTGLIYFGTKTEWILEAIEVVVTDTLTSSGDSLTVSVAGFDEVSIALEAGGTAIACYVKTKGKIGTSDYGNLDSSADSTLIDGTETIIQSYKEAASLDRIMLESSTVSAGDTVFVWIKRVNRFKR